MKSKLTIKRLRFVFSLAMIILTTLGLNAEDKVLEGKKIVMFGDSYVRNHRRPFEESWHAKAAARLGMSYFNFGRNGSSIAFDRTKEGFGAAMTERYKELPADADFVVVIAGHNDADYLARETGAKWDEFRAGLDSLLDGLREKYPDAKIGFVTPWGVDRPYFSEVTSAIKKACSERNIKVLDMTEPGIIDVNNSEFRKRYFQGERDTAHLNSDGHDLVVGIGEEFIKSL